MLFIESLRYIVAKLFTAGFQSHSVLTPIPSAVYSSHQQCPRFPSHHHSGCPCGCHLSPFPLFPFGNICNAGTAKLIMCLLYPLSAWFLSRVIIWSLLCPGCPYLMPHFLASFQPWASSCLLSLVISLRQSFLYSTSECSHK